VKYAFHPKAEAEFLAAIDYYEAREPGLGSDFAIEVHSTIGSILSFQWLGPSLKMTRDAAGLAVFPMG